MNRSMRVFCALLFFEECEEALALCMEPTLSELRPQSWTTVAFFWCAISIVQRISLFRGDSSDEMRIHHGQLNANCWRR